MKYFNLYAEFQFLCFLSTPFNHLLLHFWFYLRYKIRKIIQSSVLSFSDVLKVANFFLPYLCSVFLVLLGRKPDVRIFSTNYAKFFCLFLLPVFSLVVHKIYCVTLGNIARVYPWIVQGLTFLSA